MLLSKLKERGDGLVMVMVLLALAGGVLVYVMQNNDRLNFLTEKDDSRFDREMLEADINIILAANDNCTVSFAGEDPSKVPVVFVKSQMTTLSGDEGLPVKIYKTDGKKRQKLFLEDGSRYYDLVIKSLRLFLNNSADEPYAPGGRTELGTLVVTYNGGLGGNQDLRIPLSVSSVTYEASGSQLLGCRIPAKQEVCDSVNSPYNPKTGKCYLQEVCSVSGGYDEEDDEWTGESAVLCIDNDLSHIKGLKLTQKSLSADLESNTATANCCSTRFPLSVECEEINDVVTTENWEGTREEACAGEAPHLQSLFLSQGAAGTDIESTGLGTRCCSQALKTTSGTPAQN